MRFLQHAVPCIGCIGSLLLTATAVAQLPGADRSRAATPTGYAGSGWLGSGSSASSPWRLGVTGENTETGVQVRQVASGSAAATARIEAGDMILTVGGFQVGLVEGRLYDLADEINRRADSHGLVNLVVQDHRTGRLASVRVQLVRGENLLRGSVVYTEPAALPADAVVTLNIGNVSRPHYQVHQQNNSYRLVRSGETPFAISYDPAYIDPADIYQITASVTSAGRTILTGRQAPQVLTKGNPSLVRIQLVPVERLVSNTGPVTTVTAGYANHNNLIEQLNELYRQLLVRNPTELELVAWQNMPGIQDHMEDVSLKLMASQEYFDRVGNNSTAWTDQVFRQVVGRSPNQQELAQWLNRYEQLRRSRMAMLQQLQSAAGR